MSRLPRLLQKYHGDPKGVSAVASNRYLVRQLQLLKLLDTQAGRTIDELAAAAGLSRRAIYRHLAAFGEIHLPIVRVKSEWMSAVRYRIVDWRPRPTVSTSTFLDTMRELERVSSVHARVLERLARQTIATTAATSAAASFEDRVMRIMADVAFAAAAHLKPRPSGNDCATPKKQPLKMSLVLGNQTKPRAGAMTPGLRSGKDAR